MNIRELKNANDVKMYLDAVNSQYVKVAITDIDGVLRGKYMHRDKFLKATESGFGFCDVIFGWDSNDELYQFKEREGKNLFTGWHTGYPDSKVRIVPESARNIPFEKNTPIFLAELLSGEVCPRSTLKKVLNRLESLGYKSKSAFEYEFFLFNETPESIRQKEYRNLNNFTPGMFGYSILRTSVHSDLYHQLLDLCTSMDMPLEGLHTETGPGVLEAAIMVDEALISADKASLFKTFTKVMAQRNNLMANFMAKWSELYPGQSGHIHISLLDHDEQPVFASEEGNDIPDQMLFFIGGLQKYMRELSVMYAPTVNSYNRLCPGAWAPINMTWGVENRTTAFRAIRGGPSSQRIENRLGGADANPYLALAATLGAGLLGIEEKINPSKPIKGGAYDIRVPKEQQVPSNLGESAELFYSSKAARSLFGDVFVDHFADTRLWEYNEYKKERKFLENDKISTWELSRYFEII
jgi:glutamine synthetase